jgi:hypothetical protein
MDWQCFAQRKRGVTRSQSTLYKNLQVVDKIIANMC